MKQRQKNKGLFPLKKQHDDKAMLIFESTFKTKKDQALIFNFNDFLHDLTGLNVSFFLNQKSLGNKQIVIASYALRAAQIETFVFVHFNAKSIITTLKAIFDIIDHADSQPDVNDLASMLVYIERNVEPSPTTSYIVQQFREIMIFAGQINPGLLQHFLDTKAYFDGDNKGAPEGATVH